MDNGKLDIKLIRFIVCFGYYDYMVVDEIFEMKVFVVLKEELVGFEGWNFDNINNELWYIKKNEIIFILNLLFRFINEN